MGPHERCGPRRLIVVLAVAAFTTAAAPAHAHIQLDSASPAPGEVLDGMPSRLRLLFSGFLEPRYTQLTLIAPDGSDVATGPVVFIAGSDREFTVSLGRLRLAGVYTVRWRTAGADGHVLEGSYTFTLSPAALPPDTLPSDTPSASPARIGARDSAAATHDHGSAGESRSGSAVNVAARLLHFGSLLLLIGALSFRTLLLPRIPEGAAVAELKRRAWRVLTGGALVLAIAMVLRLWLQSSALHGANRAWSPALLSIMLNDTGWGRAWLMQALLFAVLGAAIAWARPPRDRSALFLAVPAAIGLAAIPGLSGHAAGVGEAAWLAVINDTVHVTSVGVWLGTLFLLAVVSLPVLVGGARADGDGAHHAAGAVHAFSPIALTAAAAALATGIINALFHVDSFGQLASTAYGRALLVKTAVVLLVLLLGLINWRVIRPRLADLASLHRLRVAAFIELSLALLVLLATAVLTGLPHP
ncbi:MAG: CopD family protein [Gemmatimonadota bacterium]